MYLYRNVRYPAWDIYFWLKNQVVPQKAKRMTTLDTTYGSHVVSSKSFAFKHFHTYHPFCVYTFWLFRAMTLSLRIIFTFRRLYRGTACYTFYIKDENRQNLQHSLHSLRFSKINLGKHQTPLFLSNYMEVKCFRGGKI